MPRFEWGDIIRIHLKKSGSDIVYSLIIKCWLVFLSCRIFRPITNSIWLICMLLSDAVYIRNIPKNEEQLEVRIGCFFLLIMRISWGENLHKVQKMTTINGGVWYAQSVFQRIPLSENVHNVCVDSSTVWCMSVFNPVWYSYLGVNVGPSFFARPLLRSQSEYSLKSWYLSVPRGLLDTMALRVIELCILFFDIWYPFNRPWRPMWLWNVQAPIFSIQSAHRWRWSCQSYTLAVLYSSLEKFCCTNYC
jgi:hypothetical protein